MHRYDTGACAGVSAQGCALALPGPIGCGEGTEDKAPTGGMGMDAHAFSSGQDALSKSPSGPSRTWRAWMPAKRTCWGALRFGYFLLGTQEKVTRSLGDRKRRRQCIHPRQTQTPRKIQNRL